MGNPAVLGELRPGRGVARRVGIWLDAQKPIKVLAHRRKAVSLIRAGAERFRRALRWGLDELSDLLTLLTAPFSAPRAAESEVVGH